MRSAVYVIAGVYTAAIASQACRLGELSFSPVRVPSLVKYIRDDEDDNQTVAVEVTACRYEKTWIRGPLHRSRAYRTCVQRV